MWTINPNTISVNSERVRNLSEKCRTYPLFIQILLNRGYDDNDIIDMLTNPTKLLLSQKYLTNSVYAAEKIFEHIKNNHTILVFADYDCDGITSGYVMTDGLRKVRDTIKSKAKIMIHYPERKEGYGLSQIIAEQCVKKNVHLVITVDNGISAHKPMQYLSKHNVDVIITDHHPLIGNDDIPNSVTVVDPKYFIADSNRSYLAGVGVAWDVIRALVHVVLFKKNISHNINTNHYIDVVALGTVSDVMPISPENAAIIQSGLYYMNNVESSNPFFKEYRKELPITVKDLAWKIAPDINAAGRMDDVYAASEAIFDNTNTAQNVKKLQKYNYKRKKLTDEKMANFKYFNKNVYNLDDSFVIYNVADKNAAGVIGIIAGKMTDEYSLCPCYACNSYDGILKGSVRCSIDIPLQTILKSAKALNLINNFAGHNTACVLEMPEKNIEDFLKFFSTEYKKLNITTNDDDIIADGEASLSIISENNMEVFNRIPYANGDEPKFIIRNVAVLEYKQTASGGGFIKLFDSTATKRIFIFADLYSKFLVLNRPKAIDIVGSLEQDFMSKKPKATMRVIDLRLPE